MRQVSLFCTQGEDFHFLIELLDETGALLDVSDVSSVNSEIRKSYISVNSVVMNAAVSNGILTLDLTANQTANMVPGRYIYDVRFTKLANLVSKPISGIITVAPGSTR